MSRNAWALHQDGNCNPFSCVICEQEEALEEQMDRRAEQRETEPPPSHPDEGGPE